MVKRLTIISIALIVLNIALLAVIFVRRGPQPDRQPPAPREDFDRRLSRRLDFSEAQRQEFIERTRAHRSRHHALSINLLQLKADIHAAIAEKDDAQLDGLLSEMDSVLIRREREAIHHVQEIMDICNDRQKVEFLRLLETSVEGRRGYHRRRPR